MPDGRVVVAEMAADSRQRISPTTSDPERQPACADAITLFAPTAQQPLAHHLLDRVAKNESYMHTARTRAAPSASTFWAPHELAMGFEVWRILPSSRCS